MHPITDRAEVSIDFPEKAYMSSFGQGAKFDARAASDGVELKLCHGGGPKRNVELHLHWYLFADIIDEIAASLEGRSELVDQAHRDVLAMASQRLFNAIDAKRAESTHSPTQPLPEKTEHSS